MLIVEATNRQSRYPVDMPRLEHLARQVLTQEGITSGEVSLAVVADQEMQLLNRQHLDHDYPTDVLSFVLERHGDTLQGEVIVSVEMAAARAPEYDWTTAAELMLYVIHGTLHLCGYDDKSPATEPAMRSRERFYLKQFKLLP